MPVFLLLLAAQHVDDDEADNERELSLTLVVVPSAAAVGAVKSLSNS